MAGKEATLKQHNDVTVELVVDWRVLGLVLVCGLLLLAAARVAAQGDGGSPNVGNGQGVREEIQNQGLSGSASLARGRSFYVTASDYRANEVLTACAEGYHMASLWEVLEVSNLTYAYDHPDAMTRGDSGVGPVSNWWAWIRTGGQATTINTAGRANCSAWTIAKDNNYGTLARLNDTWTGQATAISPWQAQTWVCNGIAPVWCVEDE